MITLFLIYESIHRINDGYRKIQYRYYLLLFYHLLTIADDDTMSLAWAWATKSLLCQYMNANTLTMITRIQISTKDAIYIFA